MPNSQWWQLHNFGTSSLSILLFLGGGEGGPRSGNMGAAGFGATVSGAPPPQTIVWWWGAGGTMEGPLEEANLVRADEIRPARRRDANRHRGRHFRAKRASPHLSFIPGGPPGKNKESLPSSFFYCEDPLDKKEIRAGRRDSFFFCEMLTHSILVTHFRDFYIKVYKTQGK